MLQAQGAGCRFRCLLADGTGGELPSVPSPHTAMKIEGQSVSTTTCFCGKIHRADGLPVAHACYVLPSDALLAETYGERRLATLLLARYAAAGRLLPHAGIWKLRRR
jgi:hypothetical protein